MRPVKFLSFGFLFFLASASAASAVLFTPAGGRWAVEKFVLPKLVERPDDWRVGRWRGSLARGLRLDDVVLRRPRGIEALEIKARRVYVSFLGPSGFAPYLEVRGLQAASRWTRVPATAALVRGNPLVRLAAYHIRVPQPRGAKKSVRLLVQKAVAGFPYDRNSPKRVFNARLQLPSSEPVLFFGGQEKGELRFELYSRTLNLADVFDLYAPDRRLRYVKGALNDLQLFIRGTPEKPRLYAVADVDRISYGRFAFGEGRLSAAIRPRQLRGERKFYGTLLLKKGVLSRGETRLRLTPSRLIFHGELKAPSLDLTAYARIGDTDVRVRAGGTRDKPDFRITSDPPLPEFRLLVMLATGREWAGAAQAIEGRAVSVDAMQEFIDYFVLGGSGKRLLDALGIRELRLLFDEEKEGVELKKNIAGGLGAIVGIEEGRRGSEAQGKTTQKLGAEYRLDRDKSVELVSKKEIKKENTSSPTDAAESPSDESMVLNYKQRF